MIEINHNKLNELAKEAYENSVAHGWHESDREPEEVVALFHSEISELFEDFRNHKTELTLSEKGKPEGMPSEVADIAIRLLDMYGKYGVGVLPKISDSESDFWKNETVSWWVFNFHYTLREVLNNNLYSPFNFDCLDNLFGQLFIFCDKYKIDLMKNIEIKHAYNKNRPYKHGNKAC